MSLLCWLYVSAQAAAWTVAPTAITVGDTVEITRRVTAESGVMPQAALLQSDAIVQPLDAPVIAYTEGTVVVRYQVALFESGVHGLAMPDIELIYPDGGLVTVPGGKHGGFTADEPNQLLRQVKRPVARPKL